MPENNQRKNPFLLAPALTLPILLCFGIASLVFSKPLQNTNAYIVAAVLWIVIFGAPTGLFFWMRGGKWLSSCLKPVSARSIALSVSASLLLMIHASFVHSLTLEGFFDHHVYTLYGVPFWIEADSPASLFGAFVSLALIPALMEGLFYRGILMYEYRYSGVFLSSCL
ncbi:MAG: hypothetical protein IKD07_02535, partial [Clostridia bacterium]|nr:hypothetical protein [Clostridia bacterium]